jgi:hypothetical protein
MKLVSAAPASFFAPASSLQVGGAAKALTLNNERTPAMMIPLMLSPIV